MTCKTSDKLEFQKLMDTLKEKIQERFTEKLVIKKYEDMEVCHPYYYVAILIKKKWLKIFSYQKERMLFAINDDFYGEAYGKKEICCDIYDSSIHEIVNRELALFSDRVKLTGIDCIKHWT